MSDRTVPASGKLVANPFTNEATTRVAVASALVQVEQQRAIAEVQARMIIARSNPRDAIRATDAILQDCTRPTLAESALYQYARGGTSVTGPSIRLAEAIARRWGNIASGIKELSRGEGYSDCVAYAWDLETGYYDERQFQVRHWRDTRSGGYALKDERDIYELIANMGQRRKRAVLLTVIPGDVVEAAVEQCEATQRATADTTPEALKRILEAFAQFGVTKEQIEARCQCHFEAIRPAQVLQLRKIFTSLKEGMSDPGDWFDALKAEIDRTAASIAAKESAAAAKQESPPAEAHEAPGGGTAGAAAPATIVSGDISGSDEFGDPDPEAVDLTPSEFAKWFARRFAKSTNPQALAEHNADAIADCRSDKAAYQIIIEATAAKHIADNVAPSVAPLPHAATLAEEGGSVPDQPSSAPPGRKPIQGMDAKGHWHDGNYRTAVKAEIGKLQDEADIQDWIATNQPIYKRLAVAVVIPNWIRNRRTELGLTEGETAV